MKSTSLWKHWILKAHVKNFRLWLAEQLAEHQAKEKANTPPRDLDSEADHTAMFRTPSHSVNSNEDRPIERHPDDHTNTSDDEDAISEHSEDQSQCEEGMDVDDSSWAPVLNLEQLVGLLVVGTTRTTLSLLEYERIRLFVGFLGVRLPGYKSLKKTRQNLKNKYNFSVSETLSPLEKPCFGLKVKDILRQARIANPYVRDHLQFLPELPASGTKIN
ncbi:hypothetical protein DFH28DRAFT_1108597 [Melampsora americana]|nr:hypothetical protein DFH28DRAFT_1108597 [Melampsora americana]